MKLLDSFYPGRNPQEGEEIDSSSAFPAEERQGWKLETPIDHSITKAINAAGKHIIPILPMMYLSKSVREETSASRIYQHDYQKHQPDSTGIRAKWGGKASLNPIPDSKTGQFLLDNAYSTPNKPNQLFQYYEGKVIKFRTSNDGNWHCYQVTENIIENVGDKILKKFRDDKLISNTEYKKLLKM